MIVNRYNFEFRGNMMEYFLYTLGWAVLLIITFGLAVPFYAVWNFRWFAENLRIVRWEEDE